jgi:hypothetical protein
VLGDLTGSIIGIRGGAELNIGAISLSRGGKELNDTGALAEADRQDTSGIRVKRPGVTDTPLAAQAFDDSDNVVRGHGGGLINV